MSISSEQSAVARLEHDIANLDRKIGDQERKEADYFRSMNAAVASAQRAASPTSRDSYLSQADRYQSQIQSVKSDKVRLFDEKNRKQASLRQAKERLAREVDYERRRLDAQEKQERQRLLTERRRSEERARRQEAADAELRRQEAKERAALRAEVEALRESQGRIPIEDLSAPVPEHDFFISHASEDKEGFVRALADALRAKGYDVWYDEFSLPVGANLRRSVEKGISRSRFGVVVLSPDFFRKEWPQRELDALFTLEKDDAPRILPIWHRVSFDEVAAASPILANRIALKTATHSLGEIVDQLIARLGS